MIAEKLTVFTDPKILAVYELLMKADPFQRVATYRYPEAVSTAYETDAALIVDANARDEDTAVAALAYIADHRIHTHEAAFRRLWPEMHAALS
jgi:hypothetical protein